MTSTFDADQGILTIMVPGDILSTNVSTLRQKVFDVLNSEPAQSGEWKTLQLDLRSAKMIDSTGLNFLIALLRHVENRFGKVHASISSSHIYRTFLFTRMDEQLELSMVGAKG